MSRLAPLALGVVAGLSFGTSAAAETVIDDEAVIVSDAVEALLDEHDVVSRLPVGTRPPQELLIELRTADQAGAAILDRAEQIGVEFSASVRFVLEPMPQPGTGGLRTPIDYDVAIDLLITRLDRLTSGPEVGDIDRAPSSDDEPDAEIVIDFADEADLFWQAVDAIEAGDTDVVDFIAEIGADLGTLPPLFVEALRDRDVEAILDGAEIFESDDRELLDRAADSISWELQALGANAGVSTTSTLDDLRDADNDGAALLFVIDQRGIAIGDATRAVLDRLEPGIPPDPDQYGDALAEVSGGTDDVVTDVAILPADPPGRAENPDRSTSSGGLGSAGWIAVGVSSLLVLALGVFAIRRSRERDDFAGMAMTDGLTGLNNRRKFDSDVDAQVGRGDAPTAMLMVDIDHFKQFNDTHGHKTGDDVLRLVGDTIADSVRNRDHAYRYGGEEFCVLLPNTGADEAAVVAERIRWAISEIQAPVPARLTASVGVSTGPAVELVTLIEAADSALYDAKASGRNRVAVG